MPPKAKKVAPAESRKRQASNADEQPVKRSRRGRQNDDDDEDDNQEDPAADEWADREDQATKTKGRGGRGGNRGRATPKKAPARKCVRPLSVAIVVDDCHRLAAIFTSPHHH
ncbi:hypothetical protein K443DRAFT_116133 [Laccaria amethystina LaAM-08-1]|uniref:Uncharacterized protein n=1 Tax=Laccaria amethystina LaAM-08-1 TaxID=1095629 RepID=A0A0C9WZK1_9AGAR|nr:hypothetical protein K443DRAFT_116133 [Laccaria amethystina LaAM-08-1]